MAKKSEQITRTKKTSFVQWLLFLIIPLILVITIVFIALSLLNVNPVNKAKEVANQIPIVGQFVTTEEEDVLEQQESRHQNQISELEIEMTQLESDLFEKTAEVDQLNQDVAKLTNQLNNLNEEAEISLEQDENALKLVATYQEMSPKKAAPILSNMSDSVVIDILREIDEAQRASILSAMDPESAARLSEQFID